MTALARLRERVCEAGASRVLLAVGLLAAWLPIFRRLVPHWDSASPYAYGWLVPVLGWVLFSQRWWDLGERRAGVDGGRARGRVALAGLLVLWGLYVPAIAVLEANADFALFAWGVGFLAVAIGSVTLWWLGGAAWLRVLSFPLWFLLTTIPWPGLVELYTVHRLKMLNTLLTVKVLGVLGIDAVQRGSVVELGAGVSVGVADACSGIRSLPPSLMAALFLGDLFRFGLWRRLLLLGVGALAAMVTNLGRTIGLALVADLTGEGGLGPWHDGLGLAAVIATLCILFAVAALLRGRGAAEAEAEAEAEAGAMAGARLGGTMATRMLRMTFGFWLAALAVEVAVEGWYRAHEAGFAQRVQCGFDWPRGLPGYRDMAVEEEVYEILKPSSVEAGEWDAGGGIRWRVYLVWWGPGSLGARVAAARHNPGICMTSQGLELRESCGSQALEVSGVDMNYRSFVFEDRGRKLHAFYALWRDYAFEPGHDVLDPEEKGVRARLAAVWRGRRVRSQYVLEAVAEGFPGEQQARAGFESVLRQRLRVERGG